MNSEQAQLTACMNLRIGFAGAIHSDAASDALEAQLKTVYLTLAHSFAKVARITVEGGHGTILDLHAKALPECEKGLKHTLLTGYAEGADRISVKVWRMLDLGDIHAVFPFASLDRSDESEAWTHRDIAGHENPASRYHVSLTDPIDLPGGFEQTTVLDGDASRKEQPPRSGHLEQTRFLSRWADICVVAWDGSPPRGPGGTADLVAFARAKRSPVVWIDISDQDLPIRLIINDEEWAEINFGQFLDQLDSNRHADQAGIRAKLTQPFDANRVESVLARLYSPPVSEEDSEGDDRLSELGCMELYASGSKPGSTYFWWLADWLGRFWNFCYKLSGNARQLQQMAAKPLIHHLIETHFARADQFASRIGLAHRGTQLAILLIAPLAVICATLPILLPGKIFFVAVELGLIALASWLHHTLKHKNTNRVWSDARRLAERLRILRATWPLGFDIADSTTRVPETWAEWVSRAIRRVAGPPRGVMWAPNQAAAIQFARFDPNGIVAAQAAYQEITKLRSLRWHKRLDKIGKCLAIILMAALTVFIVYFSTMFVMQLLGSHLEHEHVTHFFGGVLMISSAVIPVLVAVALAVEAKFGFHENGIKAAALARKFQSIEDRMKDRAEAMEGNSQSRNEELLREAGWIMLNDVDQWRDGAVRRSAASF